MFVNFFIKIFPYFFIFSFIFFEFTPIYFYESKLVKPFLTFVVMYSWICHDSSRFRPVWLLIFGLFYDFLKDGIVGITPLFFIILYHSEQKKTGLLLSFDFKETWIKFIIFLIAYFLILFSLDLFFDNSRYDFRKNIISFVFTIILFPIFFTLIRKLTVRFGNYDN